MAKGKTTVRGRFPKGTAVRLVKVPDVGTLRSEGGEEVDAKTVNDAGEVTFSTEVGARYIATAYVNGQPLEVRVTGRESDDASEVLAQPPIGPDRVRLSDGTWADEAPERVSKDDLPMEAAPHLAQRQTPAGTKQRSDTIRGTAHPSDPDEPVPYESQENVDDDAPQMSDTETGRATRILVGPQRQEDVPTGVWQRSDTPTGVATPIPRGGAVRAQKDRESSFAKETRGEPVRAAAEPLAVASGAGGGEVSNQPAGLSQPGPTEPGAAGGLSRTGLDAQGQPVAADVAKASGLIPAKAPAEAQRGEPKDVKPRKADETPLTSGREAKEEAVPDAHPERRAKPPKGGMAADQAPEGTQPEPVKAPGQPKKR